jgi:hypothetical protein
MNIKVLFELIKKRNIPSVVLVFLASTFYETIIYPKG